MADLAPVVDRVRELAEAEIPAPRTLRLQCWDDGDFSVRVYHTHPVEDGVGGRTSVRYRAGEGEVRWTRQRVDRESGRVLERENRVLAEVGSSNGAPSDRER